ncbi:MAG TPA: ATP-binding protein, partial [Candidatus Xenobia bacterium]
RLRPMDFWSAREFFPRYPAVRQVEAYACLGGMPAYLRQFNDERSIPENIREAILEATAYLHEEPRLLLQQELREPRNYFSILRSVAEGNTRLNDIVLDTGLERGTVGRYLDTLGGLDLVEREVPVTEADPSRSRRGQYRLVDPFMRFWFRYVHRYRTEIESGTQDELLARVVLPDLGHLVAPIFEELCRAWLLRRSVHGDLPIRLKKVGRWWNAASEIDVVGLSDEGVVLGECKWSEHPVGPKVLADLQARPFPTDMPRHYVLFSRAGFHGLKPMPGLTLVDLEALVEDRMPVR